MLLPVLCIALAACGGSSKHATSTTTTTAAGKTTTTGKQATGKQATGKKTAGKKSVYVLSVDPKTHVIHVDPMQFLTGAAAAKAYHKANPHARAGGPPNDYYIVNPKKQNVSLPLATHATVKVVQANGKTYTAPVAVPLATLVSYPALPSHPFWITVTKGKVTAIDEQFVP